VVVAHVGKVYAIGGFSGGTHLQSAETRTAATPDVAPWTPISPLQRERYMATGLSIGGEFHNKCGAHMYSDSADASVSQAPSACLVGIRAERTTPRRSAL
jgi:hypothetical protein